MSAYSVASAISMSCYFSPSDIYNLFLSASAEGSGTALEVPHSNVSGVSVSFAFFVTHLLLLFLASDADLLFDRSPTARDLFLSPTEHDFAFDVLLFEAWSLPLSSLSAFIASAQS